MSTLISRTLLSLMMGSTVCTASAGDMGEANSIKSGFYAGLGGSWNTVDERYESTFSLTPSIAALDNYDAGSSRLSPMAQLGYWAPINSDWLWGIVAQWSYLGYKTANEQSSHGQQIPNATFSSINFLGPEVVRDFSSQTSVTNEVTLLLYMGEQLKNAYVYLGLGPAVFTASNTISMSSIHIPNGVGNTLISTSVTSHKPLWAGAAQVGFNYYFNPNYFVNLSYSYAHSGTSSFNNSVNAAEFNGFDAPGPNTLNLNRPISMVNQSITFSVNRQF